MELKWTTYRLQCTHPFGISRSTHTYYDVIYIYLIDGDVIGRGEAAPSLRYQENPDLILRHLQEQDFGDLSANDHDELWNYLRRRSGRLRSLGAAFSMACLDWWTQKQEIPLYNYFGVRNPESLLTSFTIAIGDLDGLEEKIEEATPYPLLKVKLGTRQDKDIVKIIRRYTDKVIRVDANEGWDLDRALNMCHWLAQQNVEFVEQPLPAGDLRNTAELKKKSPLPIFADENSLTADDIPNIAHAFHGINIKLMKCGSLQEGKRMIDLARKNELQIMLGCMVESSVGITAASHLSPLVDFADLDGHILIDNDPYHGTEVREGRLHLPTGIGLGLTKRTHSPRELL
ncbi:MAG: dipeptide epimerase [Fidelibacterota bacterium]